MTNHELKTDAFVFDAVKEGRKKFEIRFNDRNFQVGDALLLKKTRYTGGEMQAGAPLEFVDEPLPVEVVYILRGPCYGLLKGWVIMGIEIMATGEAIKANLR